MAENEIGRGRQKKVIWKIVSFAPSAVHNYDPQRRVRFAIKADVDGGHIKNVVLAQKAP